MSVSATPPACDRTAGELPSVLALGPVEDDFARHLCGVASVEVVPDGRPSSEQLGKAAGIVARGSALIDEAVLQQAPRLQVIGRTGVGVDNVDVEAATRRGIPVVITPHAGTRAVAEGALALMLHLVKRLAQLTALVREGRWGDRSGLLPGDLDGATVGIVGYGRIGRRVAELVSTFGAHVVVSDPYLAPGSSVTSLPVGDLAQIADIITLHAPLTPETRRLVDEDVLSRVRPGTLLVNCARGGLLDPDATYRALLDGRLGGVGLDVYEPEPPDGRHPILGHPGVVLTPHVMGISHRAWRATLLDLAAGIRVVLNGGRTDDIANPDLYAQLRSTVQR